MATAIGFRVRIGDLVLEGRDRRPPAQLLKLRSSLTMDGLGGRARIALSLGRTQALSLGDPMEIDLDAGDGPVPVFRGQIDALHGGASKLWIEGVDGLGTLARREYVGTFAESNAGAIARAILDDGSVTVGKLAAGPSFPRYVLLPGPSAACHLQTLARRCGLDLYSDREGAASMTVSGESGRTVTIPVDAPILQLQLERRMPASDGVTLLGEGAASSRGASRSHWLVDDLAPIRGEARLSASGEVQRGAGAAPRTLVDGSVRSGDVAATLAEARTRALASRRVCGSLLLLAQPRLSPGDLLVIDELDRRHPASAAAVGDATLRIRSVVHHLDAACGFLTEVEL